MKVGKLEFVSVTKGQKKMAPSTQAAIEKYQLTDIFVAEIDDELADTAAFCKAYDIRLDMSANCVVIEAKRAEKVWHTACVILATDRIDVNNAVRRHMNAKKASFASMDFATSSTDMEYGGITPIGLPENWELLVDEAVTRQDYVIVGSGIRGSKLLITSRVLAKLPNVTVKDIANHNEDRSDNEDRSGARL